MPFSRHPLPVLLFLLLFFPWYGYEKPRENKRHTVHVYSTRRVCIWCKEYSFAEFTIVFTTSYFSFFFFSFGLSMNMCWAVLSISIIRAVLLYIRTRSIRGLPFSRSVRNGIHWHRTVPFILLCPIQFVQRKFLHFSYYETWFSIWEDDLASLFLCMDTEKNINSMAIYCDRMRMEAMTL